MAHLRHAGIHNFKKIGLPGRTPPFAATEPQIVSLNRLFNIASSDFEMLSDVITLFSEEATHAPFHAAP